MTRWILLRGLMREQRHWGEFAAQLQHALPQAQIVCPDLPGNGQRHQVRSATRVAEMVEFCRAELRARQLAPPYHLCALSLGGMVAVEWCARYPDEIAGAVLINTSMRPFSRFYQRLRWHNYGALLAQLLRGGVARQEALILRLTSRSAQHNADLLARWIGYQHEFPVTRANALRQLLAAARYRAPPQRPDSALLVLASRADQLVDARCSQQLAQRWRVPCQLHPSAGHDLPLDDGAWVAHTIALWLAQTSSAHAPCASAAVAPAGAAQTGGAAQC